MQSGQILPGKCRYSLNGQSGWVHCAEARDDCGATSSRSEQRGAPLQKVVSGALVVTAPDAEVMMCSRTQLPNELRQVTKRICDK
ncbi:hypothetical protein BaRGS_00024665 [Batillaria attramentaria]|uniref:Uncharacterized protein n=1 Tax=Batillaria attramentaria TaxID=370345 RepID=A0ABD0KAE3_9CAEN